MENKCGSLDDVRRNIDRIDAKIIRLLAERGFYVSQAAEFKKNEADVKAPERVKAVIEKIRKSADKSGLNPAIAEKIYRTVIECFIGQELAEKKMDLEK